MGEIFRNQLVQSYQILSKKQFDELKVRFTSSRDPVSGKPINLEFSAADFELSDIPTFKMAAHEKLRSLTGVKNTECSVKYQVLSTETAMVGVVKQKKKATGELVEYTIKMGRSVAQQD